MKTNVQLAVAWMTDLGEWKKRSLLKKLTWNREVLQGGKRIFAKLYVKRRQLQSPEANELCARNG
jgi:hypothetical protein